MSGESNRLKDEARKLRQLADEVEHAFDVPDRRARSLVWHGPQADRTRGELRQTTGRLRSAAENLRREADERLRQAQHVENTDSAGEDVKDFVTGTDLTPWS